jgi:hypothetical protein
MNPISPEAVLEKEFILAFMPPARSKKHMEKHNNSTSPRLNRSSVPEHLKGIHSRALLLSSFDTQPFFQFNQANRILAFFSLVCSSPSFSLIIGCFFGLLC